MALEGFFALRTSAQPAKGENNMTEKKSEMQLYKEYLPKYNEIDNAVSEYMRGLLTLGNRYEYDGPMEDIPDWLEKLLHEYGIEVESMCVEDFIDGLQSDLGNEEDVMAFVTKYFRPDDDVLLYLERMGL